MMDSARKKEEEEIENMVAALGSGERTRGEDAGRGRGERTRGEDATCSVGATC